MAKQESPNGWFPKDILSKDHQGHEHHLCELVAKREMNRVAALAKDARYICYICGRAAASAANLCEPVEI